MSRDPFDLAEELKELLDDHGREMFLRQKTDQRCSCYNPATLEADRDCPSCTGFGWVYTDRKILAYRSTTTEPRSGSYRRRQSDLGAVLVDEGSVYFEKKTQSRNPTPHDWILECLTDSHGKLWQPYKILTIWDVNEVTDNREHHSQFSYFSCRVRRLAFGK